MRLNNSSGSRANAFLDRIKFYETYPDPMIPIPFNTSTCHVCSFLESGHALKKKVEMNESKSQPSEGLLWVMSGSHMETHRSWMSGVWSLFSPWVLFQLPNTLLNLDSMVCWIGRQKIFPQYYGGSDVFETPSPSPMTCLWVEQWCYEFEQFNWHQWQCPVIFGHH